MTGDKMMQLYTAVVYLKEVDHPLAPILFKLVPMIDFNSRLDTKMGWDKKTRDTIRRHIMLPEDTTNAHATIPIELEDVQLLQPEILRTVHKEIPALEGAGEYDTGRDTP